jgi:polar amino acid transport system substrate-binding protein
MMRLSLRIMTALVSAGLLLSACQSAPQAAKVRVATNAEFAPFEFVDEKTKEVSGFDIELIQAIARKENFQVEIINTGFDAMLAGLGQCQYDSAIAAISITAERAKQMSFTDPYTVAGQTVVVRKGNKDITGPDSLAKKTIGAQIGTTGADEVSKIAGTNLKTYDNYQFAMQDLINGQIDAVVVDNPIADAFVAKNADTLEIVGSVFTSENYGIAVCNKNPELLKKMNEGLAALKADGSLKKLEEKWLVPAK